MKTLFTGFKAGLPRMFFMCLFIWINQLNGISFVSLILGHFSAAVVREVYRLLFSVSSRLKNAAFVSRILKILANSQLSAKRYSDLPSRTGIGHFISKKNIFTPYMLGHSPVPDLC